MAAYLIRRLWQMVPTLFGVVLLVFFLFKYFGGDPAEILGGLNATPEQIAAIRQQLGLDQSVWVQLGIYLKSILTFDWGKSWATNEAVSEPVRHAPAGHADGDDADPDARRAAGAADRDVGRLPPRLAGRPQRSWSSPPWRCRSASWSTSSSASTCSASSSAGSRCRAGATASGPTCVTYVPLPVLLAVMVGLAPQTRLYRSFFLDETRPRLRAHRARQGPDREHRAVQACAAQRDDPDPDQHRPGAAGHLRRLVPDRGLLLDPGPGPRGAAGGQPQRLPGDPGGDRLPGGASRCSST